MNVAGDHRRPPKTFHTIEPDNTDSNPPGPVSTERSGQCQPFGVKEQKMPGDRRRPPSVLTAFDLASYLAYRPFWTCSDGESPSHQSAPIARFLHSAASVLVITCRDSSSAAAVSFLRPCHPSRDTGLRRSTSVPAASARGTRFARRFGGGTFLSDHVGHRRPSTVSWRGFIELPA